MQSHFCSAVVVCYLSVFLFNVFLIEMRLKMSKKFYGLIFVSFCVFFCSSQVQALTLTVDFIEIFDTNNNGSLEFGDNDNNKDNYIESKHLSSVVRKFNLLNFPEQNSVFDIFIQYEGDDSRADNYFVLNGHEFSPLPNGNGNKTYSGENSLLNYGENEIVFNIGEVSSSWGLDDFSISEFNLEYAAGQQAPSAVPEPSSFLIFGIGSIALFLGKKRKNK